MATQDKIQIFTAAMRTEFLKAYDQAREGGGFVPVESFTSMISSTSRIEEYPWMSPPPRLAPYVGRRRYNTVDESKYRVENKEYDAALQIRVRDIEDDQVGGYGAKFQDMARDVVMFPNREIIKLMKNGASRTCFDGSNFFANSHTIGTGDNLLTQTNSEVDGTSHRVIALIKTGGIKPMIWQNRKDKGLQSNIGSWGEKEEKVQKWVYDYEGAPGFGFWWDAISVTITNTPTLSEVKSLVRDIEKQFRTFKFEKAEAGEDDIYVHDQVVFNSSTITYAVSTELESLFKEILTNKDINFGGGASQNIYVGHGDLLVSPYLNP